jgi:hypothetical protein
MEKARLNKRNKAANGKKGSFSGLFFCAQRKRKIEKTQDQNNKDPDCFPHNAAIFRKNGCELLMVW